MRLRSGVGQERGRLWTRKADGLTAGPCTRRRQAVEDTIQPTLHCTSGRPHPQSSEFLQISKCKHSIKILKNAFWRVSNVLISLKSFRENLNMTDEEEVYGIYIDF